MIWPCFALPCLCLAFALPCLALHYLTLATSSHVWVGFMYDDTRYTLQDQKTRHRLGHKLGIDRGHRPSALWLLSMQVPSSQKQGLPFIPKVLCRPISIELCEDEDENEDQEDGDGFPYQALRWRDLILISPCRSQPWNVHHPCTRTYSIETI